MKLSSRICFTKQHNYGLHFHALWKRENILSQYLCVNMKELKTYMLVCIIYTHVIVILGFSVYTFSIFVDLVKCSVCAVSYTHLTLPTMAVV